MYTLLLGMSGVFTDLEFCSLKVFGFDFGPKGHKE